MSSKEVIRIDHNELYSPRVEDYLQTQQALRRDVGELAPRPLIVRIVYSSWFYLAIASGIGACLAWLGFEPFIDDRDMHEHVLITIFTFPGVAASIGLFLGAAEGLMCRNLRRAGLCGLVGFAVGLGGGLVALVVAMFIFGIMGMVAGAIQVMQDRNAEEPRGLALLVYMMGRAAAWAVASLPAGVGQGLALRERKVVFNGLVGGVLGGLLGGLLFDPLAMALPMIDGQAILSRGVGFTVIGLMVGLFVGLVESWTKTAWLLMRAGPLAGKQFVLFKDAIVLGSSPKAEVYLFKDEAIEPRHAIIYNRGGRFEIEDCNTRDGTYVNGVPVKRQVLHHGDKVVLGKTVLEFAVRDS